MKLADLQEHRIVTLAQLTMQEWFADNTPRHAAALAYYTIFALAPLLTIVFSIAGAFLGYELAQTKIVALVEYYVPNPGVAELIQTVLTNSIDTSSNPLLTLISICVLIYGATSVFSELQGALNIIWDAPRKTDITLQDIFHNRLFAILMVFFGGLVLFVSLIVTTVIASANQWADVHLHLTIYSEWIVFFSLFGISTVIFALIYKFVPDVHVTWHDVMIGAVTTGLLFTVARTVINLSLRYTSISSIFGATGSLVVLLVWIYYSAMIFFLGAEFTQVYGRTYGSRWRELQLLAESEVEGKSPTLETEEGVIVKADELMGPIEGPQPMPEESPEESPEIEQDEEPAVEPTITEFPLIEEAVAQEEPEKSTRLQAVRLQLQRGAAKVQQGAKALRKVPGTISSPIADIAIGVAVVGAISITGLLLEPWRRKQKEEKRGAVEDRVSDKG